MEYKFGDVVLVSFPFTDQVQSKKRPALVLLQDAENDLLLARITSQIHLHENSLHLTDWQKCNLLFPSIVQVGKLATFSTERVDKVIGQLSDQDLQGVKSVVMKLAENL